MSVRDEIKTALVNAISAITYSSTDQNKVFQSVRRDPLTDLKNHSALKFPFVYIETSNENRVPGPMGQMSSSMDIMIKIHTEACQINAEGVDHVRDNYIERIEKVLETDTPFRALITSGHITRVVTEPRSQIPYSIIEIVYKVNYFYERRP